jgi:hypothetical protein
VTLKALFIRSPTVVGVVLSIVFTNSPTVVGELSRTSFVTAESQISI